MDDRKYMLLLRLCGGIGSKRFFSLIKQFGNAKSVFESSYDELIKLPGLTRDICDRIINAKDFDIDFYIKKLKVNGINFVTYFEEEYPYLLKQIYDPPPVLFYNGNINLDQLTIAIVGSRRASSYGAKVADMIAGDLVKAGIMIVSGMARGIDSIAQKSALRNGGKTVAVLGSGVDVVYPSENRGLYSEIVKSGVVVSEFLPGTQPLPGNFPARNRIISGLSRGVLVIEAGEKSGALITAQFALEQGRDVFAVPGNINSIKSVGCNMLIKEGAKMVTNVRDILEEYDIFIEDKSEENNNENIGDLSPEEKKILGFIRLQPANIDEIAATSDMSIEKINTVLTMLELKGYIRQMPGKIFEII